MRRTRLETLTIEGIRLRIPQRGFKRSASIPLKEMNAASRVVNALKTLKSARKDTSRSLSLPLVMSTQLLLVSYRLLQFTP
jgi:hypothetical protein